MVKRISKSELAKPIEETRLVKLFQESGATLRDWEEVHRIVTGRGRK